MNSKVIAIIPARGGSKRIPNKNILPFCGKEMIAWTIDAALDSRVFDKVLVSTDSETIANLSISLGAESPFLRKSNFDDISPVSEATISALKQAETYFNTQYDTVIQLMPNCPLRTADNIVDAYQDYIDSKASFQISCFKFMWMNPWWAAKLSEHGLPENIFPEALTQRSQDLPDLYCPTGAIWIANRNALLKSGTFYGEGHRYCALDWKAAIDIDTYDDLEMASALMGLKKEVIKID